MKTSATRIRKSGRSKKPGRERQEEMKGKQYLIPWKYIRGDSNGKSGEARDSWEAGDNW